MTEARKQQERIKEALKAHFGDVVTVEWDISKNATDLFTANGGLYAPRVDVAVGPTNSTPGNRRQQISAYWQQNAPASLKDKFGGLLENPNPRCVLAIEVVYSGSSKHLLG